MFNLIWFNPEDEYLNNGWINETPGTQHVAGPWEKLIDAFERKKMDQEV